MPGKQTGFFVHRALPSGSILPEGEAGHKAARGGSWEQGSVVSDLSIADCSPPECQAELGAREARGGGVLSRVWDCPGRSKRLGPQWGTEVLNRAGVLRRRPGQTSCDLQPPLNYVILGKSLNLFEPQFPPQDNENSSNASFAGRGTVQLHRDCSGPGLPWALCSLGLRSPPW